MKPAISKVILITAMGICTLILLFIIFLLMTSYPEINCDGIDGLPVFGDGMGK